MEKKKEGRKWKGRKKIEREEERKGSVEKREKGMKKVKEGVEYRMEAMKGYIYLQSGRGRE